MLYEALSWRSFPTCVALVFCCLILCAVPIKSTLAQQKGSHRTQQELVAIPLDDRVTEVLRFDTDLIAVDVRVMDREGRPVRNLSHHDFKLFEDDTERPISFFNIERKNGEQQPIAVVFALDISGSMSMQEMERLRGSMGVFSSWLAERPSLFAVTSFGMNVRVLQTFTSDIGKFDRAFARLMKEPGGLSTHTYDAIDDAIRMLSRKAPRTREGRRMKRAVVVVTDGFPVGDVVAPQTVIERANAAEVSIYTITLPSFSPALAKTDVTPLPTPLDVSGLVQQTGGVGVYTTDEDFAPLLHALAAEVTSSYVLAFYPTDEKRRDGRFHTIRVKAPPGFTIRQNRPGYQGNMR